MIIIDAAHGGSDNGNVGNGIIEKDYTLLISKYIYNRLKDLGANVKLVRDSDETLTDAERANRILNAYGNSANVLAISNILSSGSGDGAEVIYALRNNDKLASMITENLSDTGREVKKWYQRRLESDTSKDYYPIQRNTGNIETVVVDYGKVNNVSDANDIKNNYEIYAEAVVKSIANYKGIPYKTVSGEEEIYIVKKGDSLYSIAQKYNVTVDAIKKANNLSSNLLSIGQILTIPTKKTSGVTTSTNTYTVQKGDTLYQIALKFNTTVDEIKRLNNLTSNTLQIGQVLIISETGANQINNNVYIVQKGDTLYSIAQKYNTTVDEIKRLNNLTSNALQIGQELMISKSNASNNYITYTVQKGDSLYSIAQKYNTTVDELKRLNNLTSNTLQIGQELKISSINNSDYIIYEVKSGDSLYSISKNYNTTVDEIKTLNNLTNNLLQIGQELKIPR